MKQRIDLTGDNYLTTALAELKLEMDSYKTAQIASGKSGIQSYLSQSTNIWDYSGTVGTDSDTSTITSTYTMTFTGDGSQSPVIANLSFAVYANGTQLTPANNATTDSSGRQADLASYGLVNETRTSYSQTITLITLKAITIQIKVYAVGSCAGTVTAVRTT